MQHPSVPSSSLTGLLVGNRKRGFFFFFFLRVSHPVLVAEVTKIGVLVRAQINLVCVVPKGCCFGLQVGLACLVFCFFAMCGRLCAGLCCASLHQLVLPCAWELLVLNLGGVSSRAPTLPISSSKSWIQWHSPSHPSELWDGDPDQSMH